FGFHDALTILLEDRGLGPRQLYRRQVRGLARVAELVAHARAEFVDVEALVGARAAVQLVAEHVAAADVAIAIAKIRLELAVDIDGRASHHGIGKPPALLALVREGA